MSESKHLFFEADGEICELDIKVKAVGEESPYDEERGIAETMQQAQQLIRDYTEYALNAFKNFATVEEITLKFGVKMGGKAGVPFVTEGTAESNLAIEVKCKFPPQQQSSSQ